MLRVKEQRVKGVVIEGVGQFQIVASVSFLAAWYTSLLSLGREATGGPEASHGSRSALQGMSGNPLFGVTRNGDKRLKVIETERGPIAPLPRLILERPREGRCEERTLLADILPDGRFDVAASQRVRGFVVGSHLVTPLLK